MFTKGDPSLPHTMTSVPGSRTLFRFKREKGLMREHVGTLPSNIPWHTLTLCDGPRPWKCASLLIQRNLLLLITVSLTEFFLQRDIKNLSFVRFWNQALWVLAGHKSWSDTTEWQHRTGSLPRGSESPFQVNNFKNNFWEWKDDDLYNTL